MLVLISYNSSLRHRYVFKSSNYISPQTCISYVYTWRHTSLSIFVISREQNVICIPNNVSRTQRKSQNASRNGDATKMLAVATRWQQYRARRGENMNEREGYVIDLGISQYFIMITITSRHHDYSSLSRADYLVPFASFHRILARVLQINSALKAAYRKYKLYNLSLASLCTQHLVICS